MGMYTGIRFKGIVKNAFRTDIYNMMRDYDETVFTWSDCTNEVFKKFGELPRASVITRNTTAYMPWAGDDLAFQCKFDPVTNELVFQSSLKNYDDEIETFLAMIPTFIKQLDHCEILYEEWDESILYDLQDGKLVRISNDTSVNIYKRD